MSILTTISDRLRHPMMRTGVYRLARLWDLLGAKRSRNPLTGLTPQRAVQLYDLYRRGQYADVMLAWVALEEYDETLATCVDRRQSALGEMEWSIAINAEAVGDNPRLQSLADEQQAYLAEAYDRIDNMTDAIKWLGMASFRGAAHLEIVPQGRSITLMPVDPWLMARPVLDGRWMYNPTASTSAARLEEIDPTRVLMREVARPIDLPAMFLVCAKAHAVTGWDGFLDVFGNPALFFKLPPGVTDAERDEYARIMVEMVGDGRGAYPDGGEIKTVETAATSGDSFAARADWCDRAIVRRATGGELTVLTAPGSGTLAGNAQTDTFRQLAASDAASITECANRQYTRRLLEARYPGQPQLAYWTLQPAEQEDVAAKVASIVQLASAGYRITDEQASEITGMDVTSANMDSTAIYAAKAAGYVPTQTAMQSRMGMPLKPVPIDGMIDGGYVTNSSSNLARPNAVSDADDALTPAELAALEALAHASLDPTRIAQETEAVDAALQRAAADWRHVDPSGAGEAVADPLQNPNSGNLDEDEEAIVANKGPYKCHLPHCRGHREPQTAPRKGTTRGNRTQGSGSNTPLRAEPAARARKKVDAVERAIRRTATKGGRVQGVTTIGHSRIDIHGGQPGRKQSHATTPGSHYTGGSGSSHYKANHDKPQDTTPRQAARAIVHGRKSKSRSDVVAQHRSTKSVLKPTGKRSMNLKTSYNARKRKK